MSDLPRHLRLLGFPRRSLTRAANLHMWWTNMMPSRIARNTILITSGYYADHSHPIGYTP